MVKVAINGFGRIGRQVLQAGLKDPKIRWVAVNDLTDTKTLAHLLKYDSVYGRFPGKILYDSKSITINGKKIRVFSEKDPANLPWKDLGIDVVAECTGLFTDRKSAVKHLDAGAKKVLISAPAKNPDFTILKGVNEKEFDKKRHKIVSNASCTTNAAAPLFKVLHDAFGVKRGFLQTVHAYTASQNIVDGAHKDLRRARAAAENLIPTSTGAAKAVGEVIPELKGKLDGFAVRAPVVCGSIVSVFANVQKKTSIEQVNRAFRNAAAKNKGIIQFLDEPLVSSDIVKNPHSCIFDSALTNVTEDLVTVSGWYDNEWGFSCRMADVLKLL